MPTWRGVTAGHTVRSDHAGTLVGSPLDCQCARATYACAVNMDPAGAETWKSHKGAWTGEGKNKKGTLLSDEEECTKDTRDIHDVTIMIPSGGSQDRKAAYPEFPVMTIWRIDLIYSDRKRSRMGHERGAGGRVPKAPEECWEFVCWRSARLCTYSLPNCTLKGAWVMPCKWHRKLFPYLNVYVLNCLWIRTRRLWLSCLLIAIIRDRCLETLVLSPPTAILMAASPQ